MKHEKELIDLLLAHPHLMRDLKLVQSLNLPDGCIAAGYVRNFVWDHFHRKGRMTPLNDVDIVYYDISDLREETDQRFEQQLTAQHHGYNWSVKNQARMHRRNNELPYQSVEDAMKRWPETATAIGVALDRDDKLRVIAPLGLEDLFSLRLRRSPFFDDDDYYRVRVKSKNWLELWPKLRLAEE
ncbi:nucleotidyltransferase family protein [Cohnella cellulosilytica]|uniref:Nucleotidyltransferase family protein n=1 Tax=Cohnella cellulosilytica TaxID=986710 RepID=A0ABW2FLT3_9BACL